MLPSRGDEPAREIDEEMLASLYAELAGAVNTAGCELDGGVADGLRDAARRRGDDRPAASYRHICSSARPRGDGWIKEAHSINILATIWRKILGIARSVEKPAAEQRAFDFTEGDD